PGARSVSCAPRAHRGRHSFPTRRSSDLGTANTWADCERLMDKKVDYIGLGPFRFTTTKKTLSPVLGIDAYYSIVDQMKQKANPKIGSTRLNSSHVKISYAVFCWKKKLWG